MKVLKDKNDTIQFKAADIFNRRLLVFSEKLLDEAANEWFREYCKQLDPQTDMTKKRDEICSYLQDKFDFHMGHYSVWLMYVRSKPFGNMGNAKDTTQYTLKDTTGLATVVFDHYNGFWYTATKTGKDEGLVLFDYGDWYCMYEIFPLANYFVKVTEEYAHKQERAAE